jgi:hypothetical protein
LGAFIVSPTNAEKSKRRGIICPPTRFLSFNPEIKHNDGLLANSIAKEKDIPFSEAVLLIRQYTDELFDRLKNKETVKIPWIGSLRSSENNKIIFHPASNLSCNASNYGFTNVYLPPLNEIKKAKITPKRENKDVIWIPVNRRLITYTASVAAAVLALFIIPTPLNNPTAQIPTQTASIFNFPAKPAVETVTEQYLIIVAALADPESAQKALTELQSEKFESVNITHSGNKYLVYTDKFNDKHEAEVFLIKFRKDNPDHTDAWLFKESVEF